MVLSPGQRQCCFSFSFSLDKVYVKLVGKQNRYMYQVVARSGLHPIGRGFDSYWRFILFFGSFFHALELNKRFIKREKRIQRLVSRTCLSLTASRQENSFPLVFNIQTCVYFDLLLHSLHFVSLLGSLFLSFLFFCAFFIFSSCTVCGYSWMLQLG